jgi:hypothetical protein
MSDITEKFKKMLKELTDCGNFNILDTNPRLGRTADALRDLNLKMEQYPDRLLCLIKAPDGLVKLMQEKIPWGKRVYRVNDTKDIRKNSIVIPEDFFEEK